MKEQMTVLLCMNAAGTHKLKLMMIGKSARLRCLKGITTMPVIYRANKRAWITTAIFEEWFNDYYLPEVKNDFQSKGLPNDSKILLILDNCSVHLSATVLNKENIEVIFLPPNCTSLIQPMDMGLLQTFKCHYKTDFL